MSTYELNRFPISSCFLKLSYICSSNSINKLCILIVLASINLLTKQSLYYESPTFILNSSLQISTLSTGTTKGFFANDYYIIRTSSTGRLDIYNIADSALLISLFNQTTNFNTQTVLAFDIEDHYNRTLVALTNSGKVYIIQLQFFSICSYTRYSNIVNYTDIQIVNALVLQLSLVNSHYIVQRFKQTNFQSLDITITLLTYNQGPTRISTCQPEHTNAYYILIIWKSKCQFQVFNCTDNVNGFITLLHKQFDCSSADYAQKIFNQDISFSKQCTKFAFWSSDSSKVYNLITHTTSTNSIISTVDINTVSYDLFFQDSQSIFLGKIAVNNIPVLQSCALVFNVISPIFGKYNQFSLKNQKLVSSTDTSIFVYNMLCLNSSLILIQGICKLCPQNCTNCELNTGYCTSCIQNYLIQNQACRHVMNNSASSPNSSLTPNSTSNSPFSNSTQNNTSNLTNNYSDDYLISNQIDSICTDYILKIIGAFRLLVIIFPVSFYFIKFINFWSICSTYVLLQVQLPTILQSMLIKIYEMMNVSLFQLLSIKIPNIDINLTEKFGSVMSSTFMLSSDFFNSNFENFTLLFGSYGILALVMLYRKYRKYKQISTTIIILSQYVSSMNAFFLNLNNLFKKGYQDHTSQKLNLCVQISFIVFSILMPVFGIIFGKKLQQRSHKAQRSEWFYCCLCNSLLPATVILENIPLFLIFTMSFIFYGVYGTFQGKKFSLNEFILSMHLAIFHIGFILLNLINKQQYYSIFHYTGLTMSIILVVGALHQVLTLVFRVLSEIFSFIKQHFFQHSVKDTQNETKNIQTEAVILKAFELTEKKMKILTIPSRSSNIITQTLVQKNDKVKTKRRLGFKVQLKIKQTEEKPKLNNNAFDIYTNTKIKLKGTEQIKKTPYIRPLVQKRDIITQRILAIQPIKFIQV